MIISEEMLAAINKTAQDLGLQPNVVHKIYEEQVHYLEFMMSQFNLHEQGSYINIKIPFICNFYINNLKVYIKRINREKSVKYHKYVEHENKRIENLLRTHPKHVKFIKSLRRNRKSKWKFITDTHLQRIVEKRPKQRKGKLISIIRLIGRVSIHSMG